MKCALNLPASAGTSATETTTSMAAAAAVTGRITDVRQMMEEN